MRFSGNRAKRNTFSGIKAYGTPKKIYMPSAYIFLIFLIFHIVIVLLLRYPLPLY